MQRYRRDEVRLAEKRISGNQQHGDNQRDQVVTIAMFQGKHEVARDIVIDHRGARPCEGRRLRDASTAKHLGAGVVVKR